MFYLMLLQALLFGVSIMIGHALARHSSKIQSSLTWLWITNGISWPLLLLTAIKAGDENNLMSGLYVMGMCALGAWLFNVCLKSENVLRLVGRSAPALLPLMLLLSWGILTTSWV